MSKNGLILIKPSSITYTGSGSSATISENGSVSFSQCSTLRLDGVFNADYNNYRIVWWWQPNDIGGDSMRMRLSASGVFDSTASAYVWGQILARNTTFSSSRVTDNHWRVALAGASTTRAGYIVDMYGPYLTQPTAFKSFGADSYNSIEINDFSGTHNQSVAYDGFHWFPYSGRMGGRVAVYGMRK